MDNLIDLIYSPLDKLEAHSFHDQKFNVTQFHLAYCRNLLELDTALILVEGKDHLQEGDDSHFLFEVGHLINDVREPLDILLLALDRLIERPNASFSKGLHHVEQPFEVSTHERVDDIHIQQLRDVENLLAKQD